MEVEFSQKIGQTTLRMKLQFIRENKEDYWKEYQAGSEMWQQICEYELSLLPENEQPGSSFKKLKR